MTMNWSADNVREFKNGNLNIKLHGTEEIEEFRKDFMFAISEILWHTDSYLVGEPFNLSNYDQGIFVYNCRLDLCYTMSLTDVWNLVNGKTMKLYARKLDECDRELVKTDFFGEE